MTIASSPVVRPPTGDRDPWAYEVGQLLAAAIARDDERRVNRCPLCGRTRHDEKNS